jgi:hypothetical protein
MSKIVIKELSLTISQLVGNDPSQKHPVEWERVTFAMSINTHAEQNNYCEPR